MRFFLLLLLLLAPPLPLEAIATPGEVTAGEVVTVDAYVYNDGPAIASATLMIDAPAGFLPLDPVAAAGDVPAGQSLHLSARFQVNAAPGLVRFLVRSNRAAPVVAVVRVCCVEAAAARFHVYVPMTKR